MVQQIKTVSENFAFYFVSYVIRGVFSIIETSFSRKLCKAEGRIFHVVYDYDPVVGEVTTSQSQATTKNTCQLREGGISIWVISGVFCTLGVFFCNASRNCSICYVFLDVPGLCKFLPGFVHFYCTYFSNCTIRGDSQSATVCDFDTFRLSGL